MTSEQLNEEIRRAQAELLACSAALDAAINRLEALQSDLRSKLKADGVSPKGKWALALRRIAR